MTEIESQLLFLIHPWYLADFNLLISLHILNTKKLSLKTITFLEKIGYVIIHKNDFKIYTTKHQICSKTSLQSFIEEETHF